MGKPSIPSAACDAVLSARHPSHEDGGPCSGCAFRRGTEASATEHTTALARACVEGLTPFHCHMHPGLCRGFIAAINLRGAPANAVDRQWAEANAALAEILASAIEHASLPDSVSSLSEPQRGAP